MSQVSTEISRETVYSKMIEAKGKISLLKLATQPAENGQVGLIDKHACNGIFNTLCEIEEAIDAYHEAELQELEKEVN